MGNPHKSYLRTLGKAGIYYSTLAFMGNGIWSADRETTRGGASSRAIDLAKNPTGWWDGKLYHLPLSHGRVYSEEEIWENYTYFIKAVVPVAEEAGVRIGIHPDDPLLPVLGVMPGNSRSSVQFVQAIVHSVRGQFGRLDGLPVPVRMLINVKVGFCDEAVTKDVENAFMAVYRCHLA
jgi:sugar phosphate isomerase/epimerase